jgi:glycosyltransferase involved in cell wall biosynthesis
MACTPKLIATLMIKNEEKIIARCIQSLEKHVDAFCICDTGSTDNTIQKINEYFGSTKSVPYRIFEYPWKNFGESRSESFNCCREYAKSLDWNWDSTYALVLDADMELVVPTVFPRSCLQVGGYMLIQENSCLRYENTRILQLSVNWKCTGVTHEYWDGYHAASIPRDLMFIRDVGDGGCKDDKFPRDKALLEQGLSDDPNNVRYMFYLAQTLKDLREFKPAIAMYRRRIRAGAWAQEVWYSMFQIAIIYSNLKKYNKMEYWALKAFDFDKTRAENLDLLTRTFRGLGQNFKAWHYLQLGLSVAQPPANGTLFVDLNSYHKNFSYEKTVLNYYVQPLRRPDSLQDLIVYMNNYGTQPAIINLVHYVDPIPLKKIPLCFPDIDGFYPSSISLLAQDSPSSLFANVRYVNYKIGPAGNYIVPGKVNTRNYFVEFKKDALPLTIGQMIEMTVDAQTGYPGTTDAWVLGVEDVRIHQSIDSTSIKFIGTSLEYSNCQKIRQVTGTYNSSKGLLENLVCLDSPRGIPTGSLECEKNWVPFTGNNSSRFIYNWHPLRIIDASVPNCTYIISESPTPGFFENVRGSSNFLRLGPPDTFIGIVHVVQHLTPRKYYHMLIKLSIDAVTSAAKLLSYSLPFYFYQNAIEYVLGISLGKDADELIVAVSSNDADPSLCTIDLSSISERLINI